MHHLQTTKETEGTWSFPPSISQVSVNICCIRFEKNLDKEGFDKQKTIISYAKLFRDEVVQLVMVAGLSGIQFGL